jgi:hypothetical protein
MLCLLALSDDALSNIPFSLFADPFPYAYPPTGTAVALSADGSTLLVHAPTKVYVFKYDTGADQFDTVAWTELQLPPERCGDMSATPVPYAWVHMQAR